MKHIAILIAFSLVAIFLHGYKFAYSDQEIFIPYLQKANDPTLYANDALFNQFSANTSIFYPMFGNLSKFLDIETLFFTSFLLFQFFFFLAIFRLSFVILKNKNLAYLSLFLFFMPKFIGGSATSTFDDFFGYRSIGVIFLLFYLSHLLEGKLIKSSIVAAIGFLFHPLSIIPNAALLASFFLKEKIHATFTNILLSFLALSALSVLVALVLPKDNAWHAIISSRDNYVLPSNWQIRGWLAFALYFSIIFTVLKKLKTTIRKNILLVILISLGIFLANYIALDLYKNPELAKFQLARAITPVAYIALVAAPLFLVNKSKLQKLVGAACFISLALNKFELFAVFLAAYSLVDFLVARKINVQYEFGSKAAILFSAILLLSFFALMPNIKSQMDNIQYPKVVNDWIDVQLWAHRNTGKNTTFLVSPKQTGFRIFSQRSIVGDIKDGAVVIYDQKYAKYWNGLMHDLEAYDFFDESEFLILSKKYSFEYVLVENHQKLKLNKLYDNQTFTIYSI